MCVDVYSSVLLETKEKINKMKDYKEKLMESLGDILEKHVPPPCDDLKTKKKVCSLFWCHHHVV